MKKLLIILTIIPSLAFAGFGTVTVTTSETEIIPASQVRRWYIVQNQGTTDVYLKLDGSATAVTTSNGFKLTPGSSVQVEMGSGNLAAQNVTGICASGTNAVNFQAGN